MTKPLANHYHVEVYAPDDTKVVLFGQETESPVQPISEGDLLNYIPVGGEDDAGHGAPLNVLRVTRVEHVFWVVEPGSGGNADREGVHHKIMVMTTALENTTQIRHDSSQDEPYKGA